MKWSLFLVVWWLACGGVLAAAAPTPARQFEGDGWSTPENIVDVQVEATLRQHGAHLRKPCSDEVFISRVYLDMIGTLARATRSGCVPGRPPSRQTGGADRHAFHAR